MQRIPALISLCFAGCLFGCAPPKITINTARLSSSLPQRITTIPPKYHGTWTWNASGVHPSGGELPWTVRARSVQAHESGSEVQSVTVHGPNDITVIQSRSAEGEEFTSTSRMQISPDGRRLAVNSGGRTVVLHRVR